MGSWNPAVMAINGYQRYISPHKGFCCAYRVATGEVSCSEYVKQAIIRNGLFRSLSEIRRRFRDCKESARYLNEAKAAEEDKKKKKKGDDSSSDAACFAARSDALHSAPAAHAFGIVAQPALRAKRRLTGR